MKSEKNSALEHTENNFCTVARRRRNISRSESNFFSGGRFWLCVRACCDHQQGGRRKLRNGRRLRSRRPGRASYCTRGRGEMWKSEKRSVLENSFCSFFRTPGSCQEAPSPLFFSPFPPFLSLLFFRFLFFPSIFG